MKKIPVGNGKFTLVDDEDYKELSKHKWHIDSAGYVSRMVKVIMHREVMKTPKGKETDHISCEKLDNRRSNLRICSRGQNNTNKISLNKFGKGVNQTPNGKFVSEIKYNGKRKYLGTFNTALEAAEAYRKFAKKVHGDFCRFN